MDFYTVFTPRLAAKSLGSQIITKIVSSGQPVKKGDVLLQLDAQDEARDSFEREAKHRHLEMLIARTRSQQSSDRISAEVELKLAENAVKTTTLEVRKNELLPRVYAEINLQLQAEATSKLRQLQDTYGVSERARDLQLQILEIQRERAYLAALESRRNVERMTVRSPVDGLAVLSSRREGGRLTEFQAGATVRSGTEVLRILDPRRLEIRACVNQLDLRFARVGQKATVFFDAFPKLSLPATLKEISPTATRSILSPKVSSIAAVFSLDGSSNDLVPGLSAAVDIEVNRYENALVLPREAVCEVAGQAFVWSKGETTFKRHGVKIAATSDLEVAIEYGIQLGTTVLGTCQFDSVQETHNLGKGENLLNFR